MGLGGLLAKVDLDALNKEGFRRMVIGTAFVAFSAPFGWFEVLPPDQVWVAMIGVTGLVMGAPLLQVIQDSIAKWKGNKQ